MLNMVVVMEEVVGSTGGKAASPVVDTTAVMVAGVEDIAEATVAVTVEAIPAVHTVAIRLPAMALTAVNAMAAPRIVDRTGVPARQCIAVAPLVGHRIPRASTVPLVAVITITLPITRLQLAGLVHLPRQPEQTAAGTLSGQATPRGGPSRILRDSLVSPAMERTR